jgi:hypothetical protein
MKRFDDHHFCKSGAVKAVTERGRDTQDQHWPINLRIDRLVRVAGPTVLNVMMQATVSFETRFHGGNRAERIKDRCVCRYLYIEIDQAVHQNAANSKKRRDGDCAIQV